MELSNFLVSLAPIKTRMLIWECKIHNSNYIAQFFKTIDAVPQSVFNELGCEDNLYFDPKYLSALSNNHPHIDFWYVVLQDNNDTPIAFATIQVVNFHLDSVQNELKGVAHTVKKIGRSLGVISSQKPFKIITCGNCFVSGEHGIFIKNNQNKQEIIKQLAKSVLELVNDKTQIPYKISGFMLKDFVQESLVVFDELLDYNYYSFNVEPNMILTIDPNWNNFNDYLGALKTKFRVKAKKARELSFPLEIVEIDAHNLSDYLDQMNTLYTNVASKAAFNLGSYNLEAYKDLKHNLNDNYWIRGYKLKGKLVGFLSGMKNQNKLDAHFVGIDYEYNREYAIYQRMLYDYIEYAIVHNLSEINFGRTASEIKSSVGAAPQNLTIYFRHKKHFPNTLLRYFIHKIQPTPFKQKFPFKTKTLAVQP